MGIMPLLSLYESPVCSKTLRINGAKGLLSSEPLPVSIASLQNSIDTGANKRDESPDSPQLSLRGAFVMIGPALVTVNVSCCTSTVAPRVSMIPMAASASSQGE